MRTYLLPTTRRNFKDFRRDKLVWGTRSSVHDVACTSIPFQQSLSLSIELILRLPKSTFTPKSRYSILSRVFPLSLRFFMRRGCFYSTLLPIKVMSFMWRFLYPDQWYSSRGLFFALSNGYNKVKISTTTHNIDTILHLNSDQALEFVFDEAAQHDTKVIVRSLLNAFTHSCSSRAVRTALVSRQMLLKKICMFTAKGMYPEIRLEARG